MWIEDVCTQHNRSQGTSVRGWIHEALLRQDVSHVLLENRSPLLTLSAPISVCKFSLLVSIHFVKYQLGELVYIHQKFIFGDYGEGHARFGRVTIVVTMIRCGHKIVVPTQSGSREKIAACYKRIAKINPSHFWIYIHFQGVYFLVFFLISTLPDRLHANIELDIVYTITILK